MLLRAVFLGIPALVASAALTSADNLMQRASSCPANHSRCSQTFPSNFCCAEDRQCISLAGNTTLLCCPKGQDCSVIRSISCDLSLQDADTHPEGEVKTTALNGLLPRCEDGSCCPFGYSCSTTTGICVVDANQNAVPIQSSTPPVPTTTATSAPPDPTSSPAKSTTTAGQGVNVTAAPSATENTQGSSRKTSSTAVIAGASVASALVALGLVVVGFLFLKRRRRGKKKPRDPDTLRLTRSTSSFGNIISNPIVSGNSTWRTDFARKSPEGSSTLNSGIGSISKRSFASTSSSGAGATSNGDAGHRPSTPPPAHTRDPDATRPSVRIPPIRTMARQSSIAYGYNAPDTSPYTENENYHSRFNDPPPYLQQSSSRHPQTPERQREPSAVSIDVFADPRTVGSSGSDRSVKRTSHMTTFSDMLRSADLGGFSRGEPYVPHTPNAISPSWRRR